MNANRHTRTVAAAYDELGRRFGDWMAQIEDEPLDRFLTDLQSRLDGRCRVLELGCGDGRTTRRLPEQYEVVGVDVSEEQLRLARAAVPTATFVHADVMELDVPAASFDAITALYSFAHVPRDDHPELLARIRRWLRPGGLFLATLSTVGGTDRTKTWLGVEMFFSGWDAETNRRLVRDAGFDVLGDEVVPMYERGSDYETAFLWVLARNPA